METDPTAHKRAHSPDDTNAVQQVRKKSRFGPMHTDPAVSSAAGGRPTAAAVDDGNNRQPIAAPIAPAHGSGAMSAVGSFMPPPPPRPSPPPMMPPPGMSSSGPMRPSVGIGFGAPIKKPIIVSKTNIGFNIFAKKAGAGAGPAGFRVNEPTAIAATKSKPLIPLPTAVSSAAPAAAATASATTSTPSSSSSSSDDAEVDPLEAFMSGLASGMTEAERKAVNGESEAEERRRIAEENRPPPASELTERKESDSPAPAAAAAPLPSGSSQPAPNQRASPNGVVANAERYYGDEDQVDESVIDQHNLAAESGVGWLEKQRQIRKKEIRPVDHATMQYQPFRKDFYIESKEIAQMSDESVRVYREHVMEGVKIRGRNCPKPIRSWIHCGLPDRVYAIIQKEGYKAPFPIQQQAIPAIMSGRDIIACAKTGSGKTLAFVLPMLRHVLDQPPVATGEGPIGIILAPTRELATQIYNECKKFCKPLQLRVVCVYGGASVADQIAQLKRGAELVVATPGRMIDMLVCNKGNLTNLHRTTYVVLDEADRMFDMGFEPQVCLAAGTHVTTTHLLSRPIETMDQIHRSRHRVYGFNGTGVELSRPAAWRDSGKQACVRVTLADGRSIVCTPTHRLMTPSGWVEAQDLKPDESRVLCSVDAIEDRAEEDELGWQGAIGGCTLRLDTEGERDFSFAVARTFAALAGRTTTHATTPIDRESILDDLRAIDPCPSVGGDCCALPAALSSACVPPCINVADLSPLPPLFLSSSTPRTLVREYLRSAFGRSAAAPSLRPDGTLTPVSITLHATHINEQDLSTMLLHYQQLLRRFDLASDLTASESDSGSILTLTIPDTVAFAASLGFVHASDKSFRLAAAVACLRTQRVAGDEKCVEPRHFFTASGCLDAFESERDPALPSPSTTTAAHLPVFHLPVVSVLPSGTHPTYDVEVSSTHSFLASNLLVHNCKIIDNVRPDRQTVMFSATFPRSIEMLAKKALKNPLEIIIGGRSVASSTIKQFVEVRASNTKFPRLLEILGKYYKLDQCILIFVDKQEAVDQLFRALNDAGYPCASLHGGMDQSDREFTIADFQSKIRTIMVATSIVARGLDVKDLTLVINFEVPNHLEDYVHRVGRTGRAGKAGTAITFIEPDQQKYAPDLVKALTAAKQIVPKDLQKMADEWTQLRKDGKVQWSSNDGYGSGSGFKFDETEAAENQNQRRLLLMAENPDADLEELAAISADAKAIEDAKKQKSGVAKDAAAVTATATGGPTSTAGPSTQAPAASKKAVASAAALDPIARQLAIAKKAAAAAKQAIDAQTKLLMGGDASSALEADAKVAEAVAKAKEAEERRQLSAAASAAQAQASALALKFMTDKKSARPPGAITVTGAPDDSARAFSVEVEINDYPQHARWKVTHKGALDAITDLTECVVTTRGGFIAPGRNAPPGQRKLHLLIEGGNDMDVQRCKTEIIRMLEEAAADSRPESAKYAKYSVV